MSAAAVYSMTGFGEAAGESDGLRVSVRVRSVNHRHLDLALRLREPFDSLEAEVRRLAGERLHRGRVEVSVATQALRPSEQRVILNEPLVRTLDEVARSLTAGPFAPMTIGELLATPGVLQVEPCSDEIAASDRELVLRSVAAALDALVEARRREGADLGALLADGFSDLAVVVERMRERRDEVAAALRMELEERWKALLVEGLSEERIAQEAGILAEKADISEELERLESHVARGREQVAAGGPLGRALDFLLQEILREINTVGSKCRKLPLLELVLEGKLRCEQLREQVQNVE